MARDRANTAALEAAGWTVLRLWEGDIRSNVAPVAGRIATLVEHAGASSEPGDQSLSRPRSSMKQVTKLIRRRRVLAGTSSRHKA